MLLSEVHAFGVIHGILEDVQSEYQHYGRLIHQQLQAVERGELEEVIRLGRERGKVVRRIEGMMPAADWEMLSRRDARSQLLIGQIRRTLEQAAEADRELRARLATMRKVALDELRELESRNGQLRSYLSGYQESGGVDLRL